ncbi:MAG: DUF3793 family protein [Ruminococcaceae bacterium]|nr:DUF3793 family protein [Oscillospiraceae bacterium]
MTERKLVQHCAPTLAGIKTGNIFRCPFTSYVELYGELRALNRRLAPKGLRIIPLRVCRGYAMIYVYRPNKLRADLAGEEARAILAGYGYSGDVPERCINHLRSRLAALGDFPHEIGLFLGYPPEDVRGFIENGAKNEKYVGCWKVYGDVDKAKKCFERFARCSRLYAEKFDSGSTVERLTIAG